MMDCTKCGAWVSDKKQKAHARRCDGKLRQSDHLAKVRPPVAPTAYKGVRKAF